MWKLVLFLALLNIFSFHEVFAFDFTKIIRNIDKFKASKSIDFFENESFDCNYIDPMATFCTNECDPQTGFIAPNEMRKFLIFTLSKNLRCEGVDDLEYSFRLKALQEAQDVCITRD